MIRDFGGSDVCAGRELRENVEKFDRDCSLTQRELYVI